MSRLLAQPLRALGLRNPHLARTLSTSPAYSFPKTSTAASSKPPTPHPFAFAFDIDGVLLHGGTPVPSAPRTLALLKRLSIPFILLTNGGGRTELSRTTELSTRLRTPIHTDQFIQSHTPFRQYAAKTKGTILAVGGDAYGENVRGVAKEYGFRDIITPADLAAKWPAAVPFTGRENGYVPKEGAEEVQGKKIEAVYVFNDPRDWGCDLQIILDVLMSVDGVVGTRHRTIADVLANKHPRLIFSNPDLWWSNEHAHSRLGQGGFRAALEGLWYTITGAKLKAETIGKPHAETYRYAEDILVKAGGEGVKRVYMVGDNPESDIKGAEGFKSVRGVEWRGCLVESGVFRRGDEERGASWVGADVEGAVRWALERETVTV